MKGHRKCASITPIIKVDDMQRSLEFYTRRLGLQTTEQHTLESGQIVQASVGFDSPLIVLSLVMDVGGQQTDTDRATPKRGAGVALGIRMNGLAAFEKLYSEVKARGIPLDSEQKTGLPQTGTFSVVDPDGYVVSFTEHVRYAPSPRPWLKVIQSQRKIRRVPYISIFNT